jgi:hypothetical protein
MVARPQRLDFAAGYSVALQSSEAAALCGLQRCHSAAPAQMLCLDSLLKQISVCRTCSILLEVQASAVQDASQLATLPLKCSLCQNSTPQVCQG